MATQPNTRNIPRKLEDFIHLAEAVAAKWGVNAWLTLQYMTQGAFLGLVNQLRAEYSTGTAESVQRPHETDVLESLDHDIDVGVSKVKKYIANKYENEDPTGYYAQFGIEHIISTKNGHSSKSWAFPADRDKRIENLTLMVNAIAFHGFGANTYGTAYWTNLQTNYPAAWQAAKTTDSNVSQHIGDRNIVLTDVNQVLVSIEEVLKANYPLNYHEKWREWGYQREDY